LCATEPSQPQPPQIIVSILRRAAGQIETALRRHPYLLRSVHPD
jgi:hypothetical protein